jgi:hypothetical protein
MHSCKNIAGQKVTTPCVAFHVLVISRTIVHVRLLPAVRSAISATTVSGLSAHFMTRQSPWRTMTMLPIPKHGQHMVILTAAIVMIMATVAGVRGITAATMPTIPTASVAASLARASWTRLAQVAATHMRPTQITPVTLQVLLRRMQPKMLQATVLLTQWLLWLVGTKGMVLRGPWCVGRMSLMHKILCICSFRLLSAC